MRRPRDRKRRMKAGVTLVEVMLAGAMTALVSLATLEGFIVAAKIAHENAEILRADSVAFDLLWRKFYTDYDNLPSTVGKTLENKQTDSTTSPYYRNPSTTSITNLPSFTYNECVSNCNNGKLIWVNLKYGPAGQYTRHLEVFRSDIPRTAN